MRDTRSWHNNTHLKKKSTPIRNNYKHSYPKESRIKCYFNSFVRDAIWLPRGRTGEKLHFRGIPDFLNIVNVYIFPFFLSPTAALSRISQVPTVPRALVPMAVKQEPKQAPVYELSSTADSESYSSSDEPKKRKKKKSSSKKVVCKGIATIPNGSF